MAQQTTRRWEPDTDTESVDTQRFLEDLTRLSLQYRIGVAGKPVLFVMEQGDYERTYKIDDDSNLSFD